MEVLDVVPNKAGGKAKATDVDMTGHAGNAHHRNGGQEDGVDADNSLGVQPTRIAGRVTEAACSPGRHLRLRPQCFTLRWTTESRWRRTTCSRPRRLWGSHWIHNAIDVFGKGDTPRRDGQQAGEAHTAAMVAVWTTERKGSASTVTDRWIARPGVDGLLGERRLITAVPGDKQLFLARFCLDAQNCRRIIQSLPAILSATAPGRDN